MSHMTCHVTILGVTIPHRTFDFLLQQRREAETALWQEVENLLVGANWESGAEYDDAGDVPLGSLYVPGWVVATAVNSQAEPPSLSTVDDKHIARAIRNTLIWNVDDAIANGQQDGP